VWGAFGGLFIMSKGALNELLSASSTRFNIMIKNLPKSENPELLKFFKARLALLENLR